MTESMRESKPGVVIEEFLGIWNTKDSRRLPPGALTEAVNVDVDDTKALATRSGASLIMAGNITAAYATDDGEHLYVVDGGHLYEIVSDAEKILLKSDVGTSDVFWAEAGGVVYFSTLGLRVRIERGMAVEWGLPSLPGPSVTKTAGSLPAGRYLLAQVLQDPTGRQGGAQTTTVVELAEPGGLLVVPTIVGGNLTTLYMSSVDGDQLYTLTTTRDAVTVASLPQLVQPMPAEMAAAEPPPEGDVIAYHDGRMWISAFQASLNRSVVYPSKPYWHHLFDMQDVVMVPGRVHMMHSAGGGVVIGTDSEIWFVGPEGMQQLADYGVPYGYAGTFDHRQNKLYFWSKRGVCLAMPFQNLTEDVFIPDKPGAWVSTKVFEEDGRDRLVVVTRNQ